jgi:hypothetical protein
LGKEYQWSRESRASGNRLAALSALLHSSQPTAKLGEMARWVDFSVAAEAAKIAP